MRQRIPLGGVSDDLNSRKGRAELINGYVRFGENGEYRDIIRTETLQPWIKVGSGPIRGTFEVRDVLYVASGGRFYSVNEVGVSTDLGLISGTRTSVRIDANGADSNEILVLADRNGFVWNTTALTFTQVTSGNFSADVGVASLDQRLWLNQPGSNIFFASSVADALTYPALSRASAEENPDQVKYVVSPKANLWVMGKRGTEYWRPVSDPTGIFPLQRVQGASIARGVLASRSVVIWEDTVIWLADDKTLRSLTTRATDMQKISSLAFEQAIHGDGTGRLPGYADAEEAEAFFIDLPHSKQYVITFPTSGVTWVYDFTTGLMHKKSTDTLGRWRGNNASLFADKVLIGDAVTNDLWELSAEQDINANPQEFVLVTPPLVGETGALFITEMELIAEVDVGPGIVDAIPIIVEFTKNGGRTWTRRDNLRFGVLGDDKHRILARSFGRVKRHDEFDLRFRVPGNCRIKIYELWLDYEEGI